MSYVVGTARLIAARAASGSARRPRVHDLPRYDGRARSRNSRGVGAALRARLLPRLLARARRPGQREVLRDRHDPQGRRRAWTRCPATSPRRSTTASIRAPSACPPPATAEATKLVENIFRAVNIALVNELKIVFDRMGIDIWEVLDAASTKPFGFMRFNPGPGWGGHCIPLDPFYLSWKAREFGVTPKFIELAGEVNVQMPHYVVEKLQLALNERARRSGKPHPGPRPGVQEGHRRSAREPGVRDHRCAAPNRAPRSRYHDPHVPRAPPCGLGRTFRP